MKLTNMLLAAAAMTMISVGSATAADAVLCAGVEGGGYDKLMKRVAVEVNKKGHNVTVLNTEGSEDILNNLTQGKCAYGPAQNDIQWLLGKSDGAIAGLEGPVILYTETPQLVCSRQSGYDELSDLQEGDQVLVGGIGSGSALTWQTMVEIEKEFGRTNSWSKAKPVNGDLSNAGSALTRNQVKCAFGVGSLPINWVTEAVTDRRFQHTIAYIYDKDINDLVVNGVSLYEPAAVKKTVYGAYFETYAIPAVLFRGTAPIDNALGKLIERVAGSALQ